MLRSVRIRGNNRPLLLDAYSFIERTGQDSVFLFKKMGRGRAPPLNFNVLAWEVGDLSSLFPEVGFKHTPIAL